MALATAKAKADGNAAKPNDNEDNEKPVKKKVVKCLSLHSE